MKRVDVGMKSTIIIGICANAREFYVETGFRPMMVRMALDIDGN